MDTVYSFPFELSFNDIPLSQLSENEEEIYSSDFQAFQLYENEEIYIYFNSSDINARLYLDALDILPDGFGVQIDEEGRTYRRISPDPVPLYKHSDDFDALRVDQFRIDVLANGHHYYGLLDILPKQLEISEWRMMRDDLEREIVGLAQDIVRRNIGLGDKKAGAIPPQKIYNFFVIKKYASRILSALIDLQKAPKYKIVTDYIEQEDFKAAKIDSVTVQRYLRHGGTDALYSVPIKRVNYDIQENRLLKRIISLYDSELRQFITTLEAIREYRKNATGNEHKQYRELYEQGISEFINTAHQLQKVTNVIKNQEWYKTVSQLSDGQIPHSFVLDSRYGVLYKMFEELRHSNFKVQLDPNYSYSWKKSSSLYEMWCYIKLCRVMATRYDVSGDLWSLAFGEELLFPYLAEGTKMVFSNESTILEVIYNQRVPTTDRKTGMHKNPFFTVGRHNKPDITIDVYEKEKGWYIGSIILECKYRKLTSFLCSTDSSWSSRAQLQSYYTDNKSSLTFDGWGAVFDARPIDAVIVLTPDLLGNNKRNSGINLLVKALRPEENDEMIGEVLDSIDACIEHRLKIFRTVEDRLKVRNV